jgi:hypothetical protein
MPEPRDPLLKVLTILEAILRVPTAKQEFGGLLAGARFGGRAAGGSARGRPPKQREVWFTRVEGVRDSL